MALIVYRSLLRGLVLYLQANLVQALLLLTFLLMVWGWLFAALGMPDLIWHQDLRLRLFSAAAATMLLALFGVIAYYLVSVTDPAAVQTMTQQYKYLTLHTTIANWKAPRRSPPHQNQINPLHHFLWVAQLPFLTLLVLPVLCPRVFPFVPRLQTGSDGVFTYLADLAAWIPGLLAGVVIIKLILAGGSRFSPYSDPFADAIGTASNAILAAASRATQGTWEWIGRRWSQLTAAWKWLLERNPNPPPAAHAQPPAAPAPAAPVAVQLVLPGLGLAPAAAPPAGVPLPNPVAGREEQARALFLFVVGVTLVYIAMNLANTFGPAPLKIAPGPAMFSLLGLLALLHGLSRLLLPPERWYWRFPLFVALVVYIAVANRSVDKLQYENMAYERYGKVNLKERVAELYFDQRGVQGSGDLVSNSEALMTWRKNRAESLGETKKPKLVVVCCSGGGARSMAWTAVVFDRLGHDPGLPGFDKSVRIIAASSAGAVGAAYYVKSLYDALPMSRTPHDDRRMPSIGWSLKPRVVPLDSETTVVRSVALGEIWRMFNPVPVGGAPPWDRGRALEENWQQLRQVPLEELRPAERAGLIPSLILEPVTLEDGRRLLISNLELGRGIALAAGPELLFSRKVRQAAHDTGDLGLLDLVGGMESGRDLSILHDESAEPPPRPTSDVASTNYSLTGIEFSRVFDRANGFRLATAARMSAAQPMFTPAVYLPSDPPLRVIDSGFFDNYGIDVAADWLSRNQDWLRENTSGVVLVQIRAMGRREHRIGARPAPRGTLARLLRGYQLIGSVVEGALNAFEAGSIFRNDRELSGLSDLFNGCTDHKPPTDFFTTVVFENTVIARSHPEGPPRADVPRRRWELSYAAWTWALTEAEFQSIRDGLPNDRPAGIAKDCEDRTCGDLVQCLRDKLSEPGFDDEEVRGQLTWELERAENFERLERLKKWWDSDDHRPGDAFSRTKGGAR